MQENMERYLLGSLNNKHLELILYPTEQCNFRCTYCYEDFILGDMSADLVSGIKKFIEKRAEKLDHLHLSWFGGEPLIAKNIIYDISQFALGLRLQKRINVSGSMTTNGYHLSKETMKALCDSEIRRYQISLDGFNEAHDVTRKLRSGKGTFARIWKNLLAVRDTDLSFTIVLRMHVTPENVESLKDLALQIKKEFGGDKRFIPFVKPIGDWGGPNSGKISSLSGKQKDATVAEIKAIFSEIPQLSQKPIAIPASENKSLAAVSSPIVQEEPPYICYASKPNSLAIRADGRIQKCTVMLNDDRNTLGRIFPDGSITVDDEKMKVWMRGYHHGDVQTLGCPAKKLPEAVKVSVSEIPLLEIA